MSQGISSSYRHSLAELGITLQGCYITSIRDGEVASGNLDFFLSAIYVRICTIGRSIQHYLPKTISPESHWDYASLGSVVRNLIDALNTFLYLAEDGLSDTESECRLLVFDLHDATTRRKIFEFRGSSKEASDAQERAEEVKNDLISNQFFKDLLPKRQKHFLKGTDPFLIDKEDIILRNGGDKEQFLGLYKFLSANAHCYPMGFYKMDEHGSGRGVHCRIEEEYTEMMAQLATAQLKAAKAVYERVKSNEIA